MSDFDLQLPLRIFVLEGAVKVIDADGRVAAHVYTCIDRDRRLQTKRLSPEEGVTTARVIARALTVELERRDAGVARDPTDHQDAVDAANDA